MSEDNAVDLKAEDRERMQRLSEEVRGRLEEMALIAARTAGVEKKEGASVRFVPVKTGADGKGDGDGLQVLTPAAEEGFECICYKDPPGICFTCDGEEIVIFE